MKKVIYLAFIAATSLSIIYSCNKSDKQKDVNLIELTSPDKSIRLGTDEVQLLARINQTTGLNEAEKISKIEYPKSAKGYFAIVTYQKKDSGLANMVFANFQLGLLTSKLIYKDNTSQNQRAATLAATCYVYWCTTYGNCTSCQVQVTDPFGTPTLKCTCAECRLHQQQEECPKD